MANNTISQVEINGATYDLLDAATRSTVSQLDQRVSTLEDSVVYKGGINETEEYNINFEPNNINGGRLRILVNRPFTVDNIEYEKYILSFNYGDAFSPVQVQGLIKSSQTWKTLNRTYYNNMNFYIQKVSVTVAASANNAILSAPSVERRIFSHWIGCATNGWVNWSYIESYTSSNTRVWTATTSSNRSIDAWALYYTDNRVEWPSS